MKDMDANDRRENLERAAERHRLDTLQAAASETGAATAREDKTTPRPWHVYEGGNFVKIGAEGYDEYTDKESYLGGPLCIGETNHAATEDYSSDHEKAMANAELICLAVNNYDKLRDALRLAVPAMNYLAEKEPEHWQRDAEVIEETLAAAESKR